VEIADSAHKHGVSDDDIRSALRAEFRTYRHEDRLLVIGADTTGRLLEIVVVRPDDEPVVIHAMALRPKFYDLLR